MGRDDASFGDQCLRLGEEFLGLVECAWDERRAAVHASCEAVVGHAGEVQEEDSVRWVKLQVCVSLCCVSLHERELTVSWWSLSSLTQ